MVYKVWYCCPGGRQGGQGLVIVVQVVARVDKVWQLISRWSPGWTRFGDCCPGGHQGGQGLVIVVQVVARVDEVLYNLDQPGLCLSLLR